MATGGGGEGGGGEGGGDGGGEGGGGEGGGEGGGGEGGGEGGGGEGGGDGEVAPANPSWQPTLRAPMRRIMPLALRGYGATLLKGDASACLLVANALSPQCACAVMGTAS